MAVRIRPVEPIYVLYETATGDCHQTLNLGAVRRAGSTPAYSTNLSSRSPIRQRQRTQNPRSVGSNPTGTTIGVWRNLAAALVLETSGLCAVWVRLPPFRPFLDPILAGYPSRSPCSEQG